MSMKLSGEIFLVISPNRRKIDRQSQTCHFETKRAQYSTRFLHATEELEILFLVFNNLSFLLKRKEKLLWIKEDTKHSVVSFHIPLEISRNTFIGRKNHYSCPVLSHECMGRRTLIHNTTTIGDRFIDEAD